MATKGNRGAGVGRRSVAGRGVDSGGRNGVAGGGEGCGGDQPSDAFCSRRRASQELTLSSTTAAITTEPMMIWL